MGGFIGTNIMFVSKETKLKNIGRKMSFVDSEAFVMFPNILSKQW